MARTPTPQQLYDELLTRYGQEIADAFEAAIDDLKSAAEIQRLQAAIQTGDINAAIEALHLDAAAYDRMLDQIAAAYGEGGQAATSLLPKRTQDGVALILRFSARNLRAERWLRDHSSALVTRILDDQRQAVRQALVAGLERGENPRATALDIVGRVDQASGKRVGGVLGLSAPQERYVQSAKAELASSDPALLRNYLTRERRDKRFDRSVAKAIRNGEALPAEIQGKAVIAYERRLLALRGETIGRTEALTSLNASQREALLQAVESGQIAESQIRRVWKATGDLRTRDTHRALNGDSVGLNEAFRSPSGASIRFPGDPEAPAAERCNCRCWIMPRVDWAANIG